MEIDQDFESQKKLIEEELERIVGESEPEEVADKILSAAESIQKLAERFGNEEVNLSPSIDRLKILTSQHTEDNAEDNTEESSSTPVPRVLPKSRLIFSFLFNWKIQFEVWCTTRRD